MANPMFCLFRSRRDESKPGRGRCLRVAANRGEGEARTDRFPAASTLRVRDQAVRAAGIIGSQFSTLPVEPAVLGILGVAVSLSGSPDPIDLSEHRIVAGGRNLDTFVAAVRRILADGCDLSAVRAEAERLIGPVEGSARRVWRSSSRGCSNLPGRGRERHRFRLNIRISSGNWLSNAARSHAFR